MRRSRPAEVVGVVALGLAATVAIVTLHSWNKGSERVLLQSGARLGGNNWQILRPWPLLDPPENLEDLKVSWGRFDCFKYGPAWESRALGCDRPGGCDAPIEPPTFESHLDECGDTTEVCVDLFKTCVLRNHGMTQPPNPADCYCYFDVIELGCSPECVDAVFRSYGELSQRCYGFSVYTGCRYVDAHRLPEHQNFGMLRVAVAGPPVAMLDLDAEPAPLPSDADADADVDAEEEDAPPEEAEDEMPAVIDLDHPPAEEQAQAPYAVDPDLQFRQPAGTYVQEDMSGTLIEPWQYNSRAFDPRLEEPFDDDDPRE